MDALQAIARLPKVPKRKLAVAAAQDAEVLRALRDARAMGLITPILTGDPEAIRQAADGCGVTLDGIEILAAQDDEAAARLAVTLVRDGHADMLMKGILQTATLLRAVLKEADGLRGYGLLSHVSVLGSPYLGRQVLLTDAAMVPYPDLGEKAKLLENAVAVAHRLGIADPKVAVIAAVETINPKMQPTLDAAALTAMNRRGQIRGCTVDGPLALDLALSADAAAHKGVDSPVAGKADILLMPTIDAANATAKAFVHAGGALMGGIIVGAAAPIVVTSRSDTAESKLFSIALAAACAGGE